jgi:hypothetical protein
VTSQLAWRRVEVGGVGRCLSFGTPTPGRGWGTF